MEEALRQMAAGFDPVSLSGFNPCFNGRGVKTLSGGDCPSGSLSVSILVLMEEALRHQTSFFQNTSDIHVSILVLMEEALRQKSIPGSEPDRQGFNPCFNGRGVKTIHGKKHCHCHNHVSILVLMEEALRLSRSDSLKVFGNSVSILVLMEEALRRQYGNVQMERNIVSILVLMEEALRPNFAANFAGDFRVSILVLMEEALRQGVHGCTGCTPV